ncbi:MAG: EI24 domain-containing protein [Bacteroidales bacterium]|nr:EI24 domain-containing protein [Bacteroidales bacterium]MBN2758514.1 EI24 domain-containing protein [Bacteroidales bacterium]
MIENKKSKIKFSKQFYIGIKNYSKATSFIFKNNLAWTFLIPIVLNIILFIVGQAFIINFIDYIKELIINWVNFQDSNFLKGLIGGIITVFIEILFFLVFAYISGYVVIIIMAPVLSYLSEKAEKILTNQVYNSDFKQLVKDIIRGIIIAIRNLFLELFFVLLMFVISFIPVIGWLGTIVLFFISAYFYGFSFIDYINERKKLNIQESIANIRKYKGVAIGNGSIFAVSLLIPFCGSYISLFLVNISIVAAVISMKEISEIESNL